LRLLSSSSLDSRWVRAELDVALNRQIEEGRTIVLPILLTRVSLPSFLKGRLYVKYNGPLEYMNMLRAILAVLFPERFGPKLSAQGTTLLENKPDLKQDDGWNKHLDYVSVTANVVEKGTIEHDYFWQDWRNTIGE
jgi:hypothetical protein